MRSFIKVLALFFLFGISQYISAQGDDFLMPDLSKEIPKPPATKPGNKPTNTVAQTNITIIVTSDCVLKINYMDELKHSLKAYSGKAIALTKGTYSLAFFVNNTPVLEETLVVADNTTKVSKKYTIPAQGTAKTSQSEASNPKTTHTTFQNYTETAAGLNLQMVAVQGGTFQMGSNDGDCKEKPVHIVTVSSFYMGKYEVTQAQWQAVMGSNPAEDYGVGDNYPVYYVSWDDLKTFLQKLNSLTGKKYRLPTEAEWEYAAGGGATNRTKWAGTSSESSLGSYAWYSANSGSKTQPVGTKQPNSLGLYDMSGNVWEWCSDWYSYYSSSPQTNPQGTASGYNRLLRGGRWNSKATYCRVANRFYFSPDYTNYGGGFRVVVSPQ